MSALRSLLENFDGGEGAPENDIRTQQIKATAYAEGYAAGEAAATAKLASNNNLLELLASRIDGALNALPEKLNGQLGEALKTVLEKILPNLSQRGFAEEAAAAVMKYADFSNVGAVVIKTAEGRGQDLSKALADMGCEHPIKVETDPDLSDSTIVAEWRNGGFEIDIDAAAKHAIDSLERFTSQPGKENQS